MTLAWIVLATFATGVLSVLAAAPIAFALARRWIPLPRQLRRRCPAGSGFPRSLARSCRVVAAESCIRDRARRDSRLFHAGEIRAVASRTPGGGQRLDMAGHPTRRADDPDRRRLAQFHRRRSSRGGISDRRTTRTGDHGGGGRARNSARNGGLRGPARFRIFVAPRAVLERRIQLSRDRVVACSAISRFLSPNPRSRTSSRSRQRASSTSRLPIWSRACIGTRQFVRRSRSPRRSRLALPAWRSPSRILAELRCVDLSANRTDVRGRAALAMWSDMRSGLRKLETRAPTSKESCLLFIN